MNPYVSYCTACLEDTIFGVQLNAYDYRWTGSCLAVPEHEHADIRKAVLHALVFSIAIDSPILTAMILLAWDDTPWKTHSILSHSDITTLVHISPN